MKIIILFDGNFEVQGIDRHYQKGDVLEVSEADGKRLIKGLCAEEVTNPTVQKHKTRKEVTITPQDGEA